MRAEWGRIFQTSLQHEPYFLWAEQHRKIVGVLPLMFISGPIFGRFLTSQPYLNTGGVLADSDEIAGRLIDAAVSLADTLDVKRLELRHERSVPHPAWNATSTEKVHMRLRLPSTSDELWTTLKSKVRSQIKKPLNDSSLQTEFGRDDQLRTFYNIFCRNMRDLGTPPFSRRLFEYMLDEFGDAAEICTVRYQGRPVASGFLLHGPGVTLIPSASSLREFNHTSANMLMYWHVLKRAIERGQSTFDFGRSSVDSGTWKFKKQWGSEEFPAVWQFYNRRGTVSDMRPGSGKYDRLIGVWQKLPVWVTRLIGPPIVRGIP
ncbi:MAG: FemAB family PEP-CTERM system-associated protein [Planctomycetaceae bacterium]